MTMKQVSKEEFFKAIGNKNVSLRVSDSFPFTTDFIMKSTGNIEGRTVESWTGGIERNYPIVEKFFIPCS